MNKSIALGLITAAFILSAVILVEKQQPKDQFELWKAQFNPSWNAQEQQYRRIVFFNNLQKINTHNADQSQTYKKGVNQFTVLTDNEFAMTYLNPKIYNPEWLESDLFMPPVNADIDWTTKGAVSPVKNQGNCGSCWAFSAVGSLESYSLLKGKSVSLSEQQLVDCSHKYGNDGCNGGYNYQGLAYVKDKGIAATSQYPYVAKTQTCKTDGGSFKIANVDSTKGCSGLLTALAGRPIGVSVDATNWSPYRSGIFNNCKTSLDHDVLLVGATDQYWKIKNSWGPTWGENGFIRLQSGNTCGICLDKSPWPV